MIKRGMDILCSLLGLLVLAAPMLLIAIAIRLELRGAALFRQRRAGRGGRAFTMLKFRTMRTDADPYGQSPHSGDDPRLTRLGRLLRETSLDELPQLLNVLSGTMSLVGPRPLYERQAEQWDQRQRRRLDVRPGITGYAQAFGRAGLTIEEKIDLDLFYVDRQSLWLDLRILFRTAANMLHRRGDVYEQRYSRDQEYEKGPPKRQDKTDAAPAKQAPERQAGSGNGRALNILFSCVGRRVALLDAFRAAMNELGVAGTLIATDITPASPAFQKADLGVIVPQAGRIEYVPAMLDIVKKHHIGLLVPLTDLDLRSLARRRDVFAAEGCTIMIGSEDTVNLCRDKAATCHLLHKAGLDTIRTLTLAEFQANPFYPCFVKPIRGSASIGTNLIKDAQELRAHLATFGERMIVQDYVPGREYTIDVYRSRDGLVRAVVPRQRLVVRSGEVEKGVTVRDKQLIDAAVQLSGLLGDLWGVYCCQCRRPDGERPRFFEINPRFGGGAPLSIAAGANLPLYLLQEVLGLPITAKVGDFTDRLLMMRYDQAVYKQVDDPTTLPGFDAPMFR